MKTMKFVPRNGIRKFFGCYQSPFSTRVEFPFQKKNEKVLGKIHIRLHCLACHSPKNVEIRYTKIYENFYKQHFGCHDLVSSRYLNRWSCHRWM